MRHYLLRARKTIHHVFLYDLVSTIINVDFVCHWPPSFVFAKISTRLEQVIHNNNNKKKPSITHVRAAVLEQKDCAGKVGFTTDEERNQRGDS